MRRGHALVASVLAPGTVTPNEKLETTGVMAVDEEGSEVQDARVPKTKKAPVGMTAAEWNFHRLTHLPYNPAC